MNSNESKIENKKKFNFPSSIVILFALICIVTILTYVIPAGHFSTVTDPVKNITKADPNSFKFIPNTPVSIFRMFVAIAQGFIDGAMIIFLIIFGYFWVFSIVESGAFTAGINNLLKSKIKDSKFFIPFFFLVFALAGSTYGEFETVYGLIPIFVALSIALGYDALVGLCISGMAVAVGFASATTNPFTIGIAQSISELPIFSGLAYRWLIFVVFCSVSIYFVMRYADKVKKDPTKSIVYGEDFSSFNVIIGSQGEKETQFTGIHKFLLLGMVITIASIVYGSLKLGWYINEMSGVFLISGILSQLIAKKSANEIGASLVTACSEMAIAVIVVGLSRTILVILRDGSIIDSVIYGLYQPMKSAPAWMVGEMMLIAQNIINFFIPSGSGQAAAIMPIMAPLADLAGINRQVAVLAYQFGDGYSNLIWPTAACVVMCGIAKIPLGKWYRFFLPIFAVMFLLQSIFVIAATIFGYGPF